MGHFDDEGLAHLLVQGSVVHGVVLQVHATHPSDVLVAQAVGQAETFGDGPIVVPTSTPFGSGWAMLAFTTS